MSTGLRRFEILLPLLYNDGSRIPDSMGVALVLSPRRSERSQACISLDPREYLTRKTADAMHDEQLENLRRPRTLRRSRVSASADLRKHGG